MSALPNRNEAHFGRDCNVMTQPRGACTDAYKHLRAVRICLTETCGDGSLFIPVGGDSVLTSTVISVSVNSEDMEVGVLLAFCLHTGTVHYMYRAVVAAAALMWLHAGTVHCLSRGEVAALRTAAVGRGRFYVSTGSGPYHVVTGNGVPTHALGKSLWLWPGFRRTPPIEPGPQASRVPIWPGISLLIVNLNGNLLYGNLLQGNLRTMLRQNSGQSMRIQNRETDTQRLSRTVPDPNPNPSRKRTRQARPRYDLYFRGLRERGGSVVSLRTEITRITARHPGTSGVLQKYGVLGSLYRGNRPVISGALPKLSSGPRVDRSIGLLLTYRRLALGEFVKQPHIYRVRRNATFAPRPGCLPDGPIGMAVNGVPIYSPYVTDSCYDAGLLYQAGGFDLCSGHVDPPRNYHYHVTPNCLLNQSQVSTILTSRQTVCSTNHRPVPLPRDGQLSAQPITGQYHYHVTPNCLLNQSQVSTTMTSHPTVCSTNHRSVPLSRHTQLSAQPITGQYHYYVTPNCLLNQSQVSITTASRSTVCSINHRLVPLSRHAQLSAQPITGQYHYYVTPNCLLNSRSETPQIFAWTEETAPFKKVKKTWAIQQVPSDIVGVAFDGFPIYGPRTEDGVTLTSADLDECHGRLVDGRYRYHVTADFPYFLGCFKGVVMDVKVKMADCKCDGPVNPCNPPQRNANDLTITDGSQTQREYRLQIDDGKIVCRSVGDVIPSPSPASARNCKISSAMSSVVMVTGLALGTMSLLQR
ncbi:hypothetical protein Bbelb_308070 [Branchiostoma belcheri]|nr:hypothetical protein Bbelb_308070 [Branchiostoma belcheri]